MLGDRCDVPAAPVAVERMNCGQLWFAVVSAAGSGEVLEGGLFGASGTMVSAGEPFDSGELTDRARQKGAGYVLLLESGTNYLTEPLDRQEPERAPERERTCQEHSGEPSTCPGG
jgi:hypothetical protein